MNAPRLPAWAAPAALFLWCLAWILARHFPDIPPGNDSSYYLLMAKSFATGRAWHDFSSPIPGLGLLQSPSLFPLFITPAWLIPHGLAIYKIILAILMASSTLPMWFWLRAFLPPPAAFLAVLAYGSHFLVVVQGNSFMTESIYTPLLYLGLLLSMRGFAATPEAGRRSLLGAGVAFVMVARTRVVGWAFLSVYLYLLLRRREFAKAAGLAGLAGAWVVAEKISAVGVKVHQYGHDMFTEIFPVKSDFWLGIRLILENSWDNLYAYATVIHAHLLLPWFYSLAPMSAGKRGLCLAVFLWSLAGLVLLWRGKPALRPWLLAVAAVNGPNFIFFEANDSYRYLVPYHGFLMLLFLYPFTRLASLPAAWRAAAPAAAALLLLVNQGTHSIVNRGDQDGYFLEWRGDFIALHEAIPPEGKRPDYLLSPDPYFSWLVTGVPAFHNHGRHKFSQVAATIPGRETWVVCGPRNAWNCEDWQRRGLRHDAAPLAEAGLWSLWRAELAAPDSGAARSGP